MFDIIIRNGKIVDGTGNPWFPGDIAVAGDRIAAIGNLTAAQGRREIDATGKTVCPGFVDCHSHTDRTILANREAPSSVYQGVTTEIVGNCGMGPAPVTDGNRSMALSRCPKSIDVTWSTCGEFLDRISEGTAINLGFLVGHNTVRKAVIVKDRPDPTEDEMQAMERLVAESLDDGAIGLSFGLEFMPGRLADSEELRRLCVVAASRDKMTAWHIRNRDRRFLEATEEAISLTKAAGAGLQLSHLSSKPGSSARSWNRCMEAVRLAREGGQDVQCDAIPYTIGPGGLATILPDWVTDGTVEEVQTRLRDPEIRKELIAESDRYWFLFHYREWDKLTLTRTRTHPEWIGMTLREIGEDAGKDPFDCVYDILADEGEYIFAAGVNGVLFSEGDVAEWISDPLVSIAADGYALKDSGPLTQAGHHPNCFGWTPRVIQKYVKEMRTMDLEEAVRKMTSMPAERFGLRDRGILRANMMADIIVFDEQAFKTRATFLKPHVYADGMDHVIVNGRPALENGMPPGALHGRVLGR